MRLQKLFKKKAVATCLMLFLFLAAIVPAKRALAIYKLKNNGWVDVAATGMFGPAVGFSDHICEGDGEVFELLLQAGALEDSASLDAGLRGAIAGGCKTLAEKLLDRGADPDGGILAAAHFELAPLVVAASVGERELISLLIQRGAKLSAPGGMANEVPQPVGMRAGINLLMFESKSRTTSLDTISFLQKIGLDVRAADQVTPLFKKRERRKQLLSNGDTLLHVAVREENYRAISDLLAAGASPDAANRLSETPALIAAERYLRGYDCNPSSSATARREAVSQLLKHVVFREKRDKGGRTLAHYLAQDLRLLEEQMELGLDFDVVDNQTNTPWNFMTTNDIQTFSQKYPEKMYLPQAMEKDKGQTVLQILLARSDGDILLRKKLLKRKDMVLHIDGSSSSIVNAALASGVRDMSRCFANQDGFPDKKVRRLSRAILLQEVLGAGAPIGEGYFVFLAVVWPEEADILVQHGASPYNRFHAPVSLQFKHRKEDWEQDIYRRLVQIENLNPPKQ